MGPSLATPWVLRGRHRPGSLDRRGGSPVGGAGGSWSEPLTPPARASRAAPWASLSSGTWQLPGLPRLQETDGEGPGGPQDQRAQGWLGWAQAQGNGVGVGWVRPGAPTALKTTPVYLSAGQETYRLPLPPSQTVGSGGGSGPGARIPSALQNFLQLGQCPRRGYLSSLPWRGIPNPGPRPLGREGILGEEGPRSRPCPQPPQTHPNLKAMRVRVYRNYVQSPEKPPLHPLGKKKTRQKLIYIFCIWSSVLNINCVIFIHFLSLNSPLIYQFNVSRGFFSHGVLRPAPTPLFDLRRLILSIVAFRPHVTTL